MPDIRFLGPWGPRRVATFLTETKIPLRLAFSAADATPRVLPLWFVYSEDRIWCAMQRSSFSARCLAGNSACGFDVSVEQPPYRGVRGTAIATLVADQGEAVLEKCIAKYLGDSDPKLSKWLLSRAQEEVVFCLELRSVSSWDFRGRMSEPEPKATP